MMNTLKTITPLLKRGVVFLCFFLIITGVAGPKIIGSDVMFRDGFAHYGGIGKALIFGLIAFILLVRHNKSEITLRPWSPALLGWFAASVGSFILAWVSIDGLLADQRSVITLAGAHLGLLCSIILAAIGSFGPKNIQLLATSYKREIITAAGLTIFFYIFLNIVYALWEPLASVVLYFVNILLGISGLTAVIVPPHTLLFDKFGITIAEFCSGIESIALFTSLYAIVGLLDWKRIRKRRYFIVFPFALLFLFGLNIVRVYGLIMAGYYINPEIAFSLFHTYAGMVFFILYSALFWAVAYKHLLVLPKKEPHE